MTGSALPGRRGCATLPIVDDVRDLNTTGKRCAVCGEAFRPFPAPKASTLMEVQVRAHGRRIQRQCSHQECRCLHVPGIVTAPPAPRLMPKSPLGCCHTVNSCHPLLALCPKHRPVRQHPCAYDASSHATLGPSCRTCRSRGCGPLPPDTPRLSPYGDQALSFMAHGPATCALALCLRARGGVPSRSCRPARPAAPGPRASRR
jgi:hypothetical protein